MGEGGLEVGRGKGGPGGMGRGLRVVQRWGRAWGGGPVNREGSSGVWTVGDPRGGRGRAGVRREWRGGVPGRAASWGMHCIPQWAFSAVAMRMHRESSPFTVMHLKRRSGNVIVHQIRSTNMHEDLGSVTRGLPFAPFASFAPSTPRPPYAFILRPCAPFGGTADTAEHRKIAVIFSRQSSRVCTCCPRVPLRLFRAPWGRCIWG